MERVTMQKLMEDFGNNQTILDALVKTDDHLNSYDKVLVSVSGGSDSDIIVDMMEYLKSYHKNVRISYVWFDTGMEYEATKQQIDYLEQRYGITIERIRAKTPVPLACQKSGLPFLNKQVSQRIYELQKQGFQWEDEPYDVLSERYSNCEAGLKWWCDEPDRRPYTITQNKWLKKFMVEHPPTFKISKKCCDYAKKHVAREREREREEKFEILGIRKAEGGVRSHLKSCFSSKSSYRDIDLFRPVFWFSDDDKRYYEQKRNIQHSDCYTVYGFERTGCACCPYGREFEEELVALEKYEPKMYRAAIGVFQKSYEYTRQYREFYKMMNEKQKLEKAEEDGQISLF